MRRLLLATVALGLMFGATVAPRTDGHARTNEGHAVIILNPANGLPPGWAWDR